jgi:hypothetical protein
MEQDQQKPIEVINESLGWKPKKGSQRRQVQAGPNKGKYYWSIKNDQDNSLVYFEWEDPDQRQKKQKQSNTASEIAEIKQSIRNIEETLEQMKKVNRENYGEIKSLLIQNKGILRKIHPETKKDGTGNNWRPVERKIKVYKNPSDPKKSKSVSMILNDAFGSSGSTEETGTDGSDDKQDSEITQWQGDELW